MAVRRVYEATSFRYELQILRSFPFFVEDGKVSDQYIGISIL